MSAISGPRTSPELLDLLACASRRVMTPEERFEQRVSYVYSCMRADSGITKDAIREALAEFAPRTAFPTGGTAK